MMAKIIIMTILNGSEVLIVKRNMKNMHLLSHRNSQRHLKYNWTEK